MRSGTASDLAECDCKRDYYSLILSLPEQRPILKVFPLTTGTAKLPTYHIFLLLAVLCVEDLGLLTA